MSEHDAELVVKQTRKGQLIVWRWVDGRRTVSQTEIDEMADLISETEHHVDLNEYESDDVLTLIWMDGETIQNVRWNDE